jgi:YVTN family beta-propeller protein
MRVLRTSAWILTLLFAFLSVAQSKVIYAYVAVNDAGQSGGVAVINTTTKKVVKTISVGSLPTYVAVNPAGSLAYVAGSSGQFSVINTATNSVVDSYQVVGGVLGMVFAPNGETAYILINGGVGVLNIKTKKFRILDVPYASALALTPDGKFLYVPDVVGLTVSVVSTATKQVVASIDLGIPAGSYPDAIAITPDGTKAYVGYWNPLHPQNASGFQVIDIASKTVVNSISVNYPTSATISPNGRWLYAGLYFEGLAIIDTSTQTVAHLLPSGASTVVAFTSNSAFAYIGNSSGGCVGVLNTTRLTGPCIDVGHYPLSVAVMSAH